jgi:regulator of cell morphogenesis and NO signaling
MNAAPTVRQLVAECPRRARVFEKWGISYCCCGGSKTLSEACAGDNVDERLVLTDLKAVDASLPTHSDEETEVDWSQAALSDLLEQMITVPHSYLRDELPRLSRLLDKVIRRHGDLYPELWELWGLFEGLERRMKTHMAAAEDTLFPLFVLWETDTGMTRSMSLPYARSGGSSLLGSGIVDAISVQQREHAFLCDMLLKLRIKAESLIPVDKACNTYRVLLSGVAELDSGVAELDAELRRHIRMEEDVIFPRYGGKLTVAATAGSLSGDR